MRVSPSRSSFSTLKRALPRSFGRKRSNSLWPRSGDNSIAVPEFTSLCPVTGQPDFAHLVIDYAPGETIVESKSLKLFLGAFRNHCGFHEDVTVGIGQRLVEEMGPQWLRIGGYWYPRGGMPIDVFWQSGPPPQGLWLPDQGVAGYRGRG